MPVVHLAYRPYGEVSAEPNVVVDGTATGRTTLTLSHWPGSPPVPADVQADLSAQMAFRYLDHCRVDLDDIHRYRGIIRMKLLGCGPAPKPQEKH